VADTGLDVEHCMLYDDLPFPNKTYNPLKRKLVYYSVPSSSALGVVCVYAGNLRQEGGRQGGRGKGAERDERGQGQEDGEGEGEGEVEDEGEGEREGQIVGVREGQVVGVREGQEKGEAEGDGKE